MTVLELIEKLKLLDPNKRVVVENNEIHEVYDRDEEVELNTWYERETGSEPESK